MLPLALGPEPATAHLVLGLVAVGIGVIFLWLDRHQSPSRALGAGLAAMGVALFLGGFAGFAGPRVTPPAHVALDTLIALSILAGVEWGRRIGAGTAGGVARAANVLFRVSQGFVLLYWLFGLGRTALSPAQASLEGTGLIGHNGAKTAVLGSLLGCALLLAAVAILLLRFLGRIDRIEIVRLRALMLAAPFLLTGVWMQGTPMMLLMAVGLLVYLAGSVRYLVVQHERGRFASRFVSPQLAQLARGDLASSVFVRERRRLTVLACDLRGFTAYARRETPEAVVELLEQYYGIVGAVAAAHGGAIKDHAGDGVLVLVGAPVAVRHAEVRATTLALDLLARVSGMLRDTQRPLGLGVGIASGEVIVGALQGAARLEYAAVGNAVNLAARLCGRAEDQEILIDAETAGALGSGFVIETKAAESLKGYPEPVPVFGVSLAANIELARPLAPAKKRKKRRDSTDVSPT